MKYSILKSFGKRIIKSNLILTLLLVCFLTIGIIGTSYSLYMDVGNESDYQVVNIGDLSIGFDNGNNIINFNGLRPISDVEAQKSAENIFSFYIYNTSKMSSKYDISLVPILNKVDENGNVVEYNEIDPDYIRFQVCRDNAKNCDDIKNLGDYVILENGGVKSIKSIYVDELFPKREGDKANPGAYYFLRLWLKNEGYGTPLYNNSLVGKRIKYEVVIRTTNN